MEFSIEKTIMSTILAILEQRNQEIGDIDFQSALSDDVGLTSMDLAELVSLLEQEFSVDPFEELVPITDMVTVENICDAYRTALSQQEVEA